MAVNIQNLIAAINPDLYCSKESVDKVKKVISESLEKGESDAYIKASSEAKPKEFEPIDFLKLLYRDVSNPKKILKNPIERHTLSYDSFGESLEPVYFWILDTLESFGFKNEKLVDNFISSPGSGHFSEMGIKQSRMQEEGMKMLGAANQVIKSILNIIYDLKEFEIRLKLYDRLKSEKKEEKQSAILSLKQVWLDTVDAKRGNSSIKAMALTQANFVTLIDAFMAAENEKLEYNGVSIDLNERVRRILQQRIGEFNVWLVESEKELRKRYDIEKIYLRSQYNTVQLYARWAKPYLKAAKSLEQNASPTASLVTVFNTTLYELTLLAKGKYDINDDVANGSLPKMFKDTNKRGYSPIIIVELKFRSSPEKYSQNYGFRGRVDISFTSYCLNEEELKLLKEQVAKDDFGDVLGMIEGSTGESLGKLQEDIDNFLGDKKEKKEVSKNKSEENEDINPFSELFSFFKREKKEDKKEKKKTIEKDSDIEKVIRAQSILDARKRCVKFYETYKKAHKMPAFGTLDDVF